MLFPFPCRSEFLIDIIFLLPFSLPLCLVSRAHRVSCAETLAQAPQTRVPSAKRLRRRLSSGRCAEALPTTLLVRIFEIYSLSKHHVCNIALLTAVTMLYIRFPELVHLITGSLHLLNHVSPYSTPTPHQPLTMTILLCGFMNSTFLDFTYTEFHTVFVFV